jgi:(2Fe-2S) ferredoxin
MYWTKKHILVCTASHCAQKGANEMIGKLRLEVIRRGLDTEILVNNCGTIDLCDIGPNLVIYPDNTILSGVTAKDVKSLVAYLTGDGDMSSFVTGPDTSAETQRRQFFLELISDNASHTEGQFASIAEKHGFDAAWIDEQARRGFIARKPSPETGETMITVTSKTLHRYSL